MQKIKSILDRMAGLIVGAAFIIVGLFLVVLGLTFLPAVGIFVGIPVMALSGYFLSPARKVYLAEEESRVFTYGEKESWCAWPPFIAGKRAV